MEKITLVKLGGSLITNKSKPFTLQESVLEDVIGQVSKAVKKGHKIVLGHGAGSFAHVPAEKYKTIKGNLGRQSLYGAAVVADAACQLNRIVVSEALKQNIPAVSIPPLSFARAKNRASESVNINNIMYLLAQKLVPVVYGDVVLDSEIGFTIWSTETVLNSIVEEMINKNIHIDKVIHTGEPDGFIVNNSVVPEINTKNFEEMKKEVYATEGFDVTGGMLHKVEESLRLAQENGIDSYIIGGNHGGNLYRCIVGEEFLGTKVTS